MNRCANALFGEAKLLPGEGIAPAPDDDPALQLVLALIPSLCSDAVLALIRCCWRRLTDDQKRSFFSHEHLSTVKTCRRNSIPDPTCSPRRNKEVFKRTSCIEDDDELGGHLCLKETLRHTSMTHTSATLEKHSRKGQKESKRASETSGNSECGRESFIEVDEQDDHDDVLSTGMEAAVVATSEVITPRSSPDHGRRSEVIAPRSSPDHGRRSEVQTPRSSPDHEQRVRRPEAMTPRSSVGQVMTPRTSPDLEQRGRRSEAREQPLVVDVSCARGNAPALALLAEENPEDCQTCSGDGADIVWVVRAEDMTRKMLTLPEHAWLSHVPGVLRVCSKVELSEALQAREAKFWPPSWSFPEASFEDICREAHAEGGAALIVKPSTGSHGSGIFLALDKVDLELALKKLQSPQRAVVQQYIDPPMLLDGHKWDLRLYALLIPDSRGCLTAYVATEGLVRVSVDRYERPDPSNLYRSKMHLSNYSISKYYDTFSFGDGSADDAARGGSKQLLSEVLGKLEAEDLLIASGTMRALRRLVRRTVRAMERPIQEYCFSADSWGGSLEAAELARSRLNRCFHIVGLDVLLDDSGKPWLLEVNNNPSLSIDELRPLYGKCAQVNQLFAATASARTERPGAALGRPEAPKGRPRSASAHAGAGLTRNGSRQRASRECPEASSRPRHPSGAEPLLAVPDGCRPCRCSGHPRPHTHHRCPVDVTVKLPLLRGVLQVLRRVDAAGGIDARAWSREDLESWAEGTSLEFL